MDEELHPNSPDTLPNQPPTPMFNFKPQVNFTPKHSKKNRQKSSKTTTPQNSTSKFITPQKMTPKTKTSSAKDLKTLSLAAIQSVSPSTPKKKKFKNHQIVNNFYNIEVNKPKMVDKKNQTPAIGIDLSVRKNKQKSTGFQYYSQPNAAIDPSFYYKNLRNDIQTLNPIFDQLLNSGNIMDDDLDVKEKLHKIFNKQHFLSDEQFMGNLTDPRSFEFTVWSSFLVENDKELINQGNFFENLQNHKMTLAFREKYFDFSEIDEFLKD